MSTFDMRKGVAGFHAGGVFEIFTAQFVIDFAAYILKDPLSVAAGSVIEFGDIPAGSILLGMSAFIEKKDTATTPDPIIIGTGADDNGFFTAVAPDDDADTMALADGALKPGIGGNAYEDDTPLQLTLDTNLPKDGIIIVTAVLARAKRA